MNTNQSNTNTIQICILKWLEFGVWVCVWVPCCHYIHLVSESTMRTRWSRTRKLPNSIDYAHISETLIKCAIQCTKHVKHTKSNTNHVSMQQLPRDGYQMQFNAHSIWIYVSIGLPILIYYLFINCALRDWSHVFFFCT